MEKFLQAALIAWNPLRSVKERKSNEKLDFAKVLTPFVGIILTCAALDTVAFQFFINSFPPEVISQLPQNASKMLDNLDNSFFQNMSAIVSIILATLTVSILPRKVFSPVNVNMTISTLIIISASFSFYHTVNNTIFYFFMGIFALVDISIVVFCIYCIFCLV